MSFFLRFENKRSLVRDNILRRQSVRTLNAERQEFTANQICNTRDTKPSKIMQSSFFSFLPSIQPFFRAPLRSLFFIFNSTEQNTRTNRMPSNKKASLRDQLSSVGSLSLKKKKYISRFVFFYFSFFFFFFQLKLCNSHSSLQQDTRDAKWES